MCDKPAPYFGDSFIFRRLVFLAVVAWMCFLQLAAPAAIGTEPVSFRSQIAPLLVEHCISCHGPKKAEGGYRLDSFAELSKAGDSGILPLNGSPGESSELLRRLTTTDANERMPAERDPLPQTAIELVARWQNEGSRFDAEKAEMPLFELMPSPVYAAPPVAYPTALPVTALAFSPSGDQLIVGGYHEATVWDIVSGKMQRRISNLPERIMSFDWDADNQRLAVAGGAPGRIGEVRIVDWESGQVSTSLGRAGDVVHVARFQPGGNWIATGNSDGTVRWFDALSGQLQRNVAGHADIVYDVAFSPDGLRLASASRDKTAKVFVLENAELIATYSAHNEPVVGIGFLEGGKELISLGADRKLHRWQVEEAKNLAKVDVPGLPTRLLADRGQAWVGVLERTIRQFDIVGGKSTRTLEGHTAAVTALAVHASGGRLATGGLDGYVRIWKQDDGALIHQWLAKP